MRKSTLLMISTIIALPIVYFARYILMQNDIWIGPKTFVGTGLLAFLLSPLIAAMLTPLNKKLLAKRKEAGRDIEDEERYESDHGMISLRPNDDK